MNFNQLTQNLVGITNQEKILYSKLENAEFITQRDIETLKEVFYDLCKNKIADSILYSRLGVRIEYLKDHSEELEFEKDDLEIVAKNLKEHSIEEMELFQVVFNLAMQFGMACSFDFNVNVPAAAMKFKNIKEMINFVQTREVTSIYKFNVLLNAFVSTEVLNSFNDEVTLEMLESLINVFPTELEHFDDLEYLTDDVKLNEGIIDKINDIISKGF